MTTAGGVALGKKAVDLCQKLGLDILCTAIGGHYSEDEDKSAFMSHIQDLADYAAAHGVTIALEVHGDIMASGQISLPLIRKSIAIMCGSIMIRPTVFSTAASRRWTIWSAWGLTWPIVT